MLSAIRRARVGGAYWRRLSSGTRISVANPGTFAQAIDLGRHWSLGDGPLLFLLPATAWARPARLSLARRFQVFVGEVDPWPILDRATQVIAAPSSELAVLAKAAGVPVAIDADRAPWAGPPSIAAIDHRLIKVDYVDPFSGQTIPIERWIDILAGWRHLIDTNRGITRAWGFRRWKRDAMRTFLWSGTDVSFRPSARRAIGANEQVAIWPTRVSARCVEQVEAAKAGVLRVEDGFIRSLGLGCHLHPPLSVTIDTMGCHYDPSRPSELESLLAAAPFDAPLIERAERLVDRIVANRITKYGDEAAEPPALPDDRRLVLVAGQVDDDASVRLGAPDIATNLDLLARVRAIEPDAFVIYKPHPDVSAGLRRGHVDGASARLHADLVVDGIATAALLERVDAVHVRTSLIGFEALLRRREVVVHGSPFYSGWGLTTDLGPAIARRRRRLTLAELVAATLILYPRYRDPITRLPCPPEIVVERLAKGELPAAVVLPGLRRWQGRLAIATNRFLTARA